MNPKGLQTALDLREIQLPESLLWWPLAPGWWIIVGLLVVFLIGILIFKKTYSKRIMNNNINLELVGYYKQFQKNSDPQIFIKQLSALLRRVSLYCFQEHAIAKLQGLEWLTFLDSKLPEQQSGKNSKRSFKSGAGKIFLLGPYQKNVDDDLYPVYELVEYWININLKLHKRLR